jgi:phospholipid/cholesterol/gamma-HCH transport system substrate-binding protein
MAQVKVGIVVAVSLFVLGVAIFFMGRERRLFERRVPYEIRFSRTNGLRVGAPVALTGVAVGSVEGIAFPRDIEANYVTVEVRIVGEAAPRVRLDTVARIRTLGLLGDKFIELSGGSATRPPVVAGGLIASINPVDYEAILGEGGDVVSNLIELTNSLKEIFKSAEEGKGLLGQLIGAQGGKQWSEISQNLGTASLSLKNVLAAVERGEGFLGKLIRGGESGKAMSDNLQAGLVEFRKAGESLRRIAEKIERGEGALGTLVQDPKGGREILDGLGRAIANLERVTHALREGEGLLPRLIADKSYADQVLGNLDDTARDLARIAGKIEQGEGTLGALVNDPQLYKDAKEIVGEAKGSWLFSIYRFFRGLGSSADEPKKEPAR